MALRIYLPTFPLLTLSLLSGVTIFLPEKSDTGFVDYSSLVANYDISASAVQKHILKQHQSS